VVYIYCQLKSAENYSVEKSLPVCALQFNFTYAKQPVIPQSASHAANAVLSSAALSTSSLNNLLLQAQGNFLICNRIIQHQYFCGSVTQPAIL
jgi:hypothetical protein